SAAADDPEPERSSVGNGLSERSPREGAPRNEVLRSEAPQRSSVGNGLSERSPREGAPRNEVLRSEAPQRSSVGNRVSVVASIGYTAFLAGPPILGYLGDH